MGKRISGNGAEIVSSRIRQVELRVTLHHDKRKGKNQKRGKKYRTEEATGEARWWH